MKRSPKQLLLLSYVTVFMSVVELEQMEKFAGPIIWVDSHDLCPFSSFTLVSRGVAFRDLPIPKQYISAEPCSPARTQLFSENLLRLETISYELPKNDSVLYWERMRPFGKSVQWTRQELAPLVLDSVKDGVCHQYNNNSYLAVTGLMSKPVDYIVMEQETKVTGRRIYGMSKSHPAINSLRKRTFWYENADLFYCIFPDKISSYDCAESLATATVKVVPYVSNFPRLYCAKLLSSWNVNTVTVLTIHGILKWRLWSKEIKAQIEIYLREFAVPGWDRTLDSTDIVTFPWSPGPEVVEQVRVYNRTRVLSPNPCYFPWLWAAEPRKICSDFYSAAFKLKFDIRELPVVG